MYFNLAVIYRSPSSSAQNTVFMFALLDTQKSSSQGKLIIVGDFNYWNIDWQNVCTEKEPNTNAAVACLLKCPRTNCFIQHVLTPTRGRGTPTPSILDLVIINEDFVESVDHLSPLGKSDHSVLYINCALKCTANNVNISKLNYAKGN